MKFRFVKIITTVVLLIALTTSLLCGCRHNHQYSREWSADYRYHWKEPICCDEANFIEVAKHSFENDVCTVCGHQVPAKLMLFSVVGNFHTELQTAFLEDDYENVHRYAVGNAEKSLPQGIEIYWHYAPRELPIEGLKEFRLEITNERGDLLSKTLDVSLNENNIQMYLLQNAFLNTRYSVKVQAVDNANEVVAVSQNEFVTTDKYPRNLLVQGVTNVRDIGGYVTDQGTIKQGMLFRTARLNKSSADEIVVEITDEGKRVMLEEMKVKTEIDLRGIYESSNLTASVLGDTVNYHCMDMGVLSLNAPEQKAKIKSVFDLLCDKNNYPIFFHCHIGTDRTGIIAFLCEALLGADEQTLYVDYLFSNFGHIGSGRHPYTLFTHIKAMNSYEGDSLAQKTENYLYDCGITQAQIKAFKDIMLEK